MTPLALAVILCVIGTLASGLFSGAETGAYRFNRTRHRLALASGRPKELSATRRLFALSNSFWRGMVFGIDGTLPTLPTLSEGVWLDFLGGSGRCLPVARAVSARRKMCS